MLLAPPESVEGCSFMLNFFFQQRELSEPLSLRSSLPKTPLSFQQVNAAPCRLEPVRTKASKTLKWPLQRLREGSVTGLHQLFLRGTLKKKSIKLFRIGLHAIFFFPFKKKKKMLTRLSSRSAVRDAWRRRCLGNPKGSVCRAGRLDFGCLAAGWPAVPGGFSRRFCTARSRSAVRIGCASGFWGDTTTSVPQLVYGGKLDFLVFDYLSEITMSLLTAAKARSPSLGYAPDFVQVALAPFINDIHKQGIRVVSNAGGVNPHACAAAIEEVVRKANLDLTIAVVVGDDLMGVKESLKRTGMTDMDSGRPFPESVNSMNAYLGARPISRALDLGADIVVTGRCVDSGVVLGPLIHKFGWEADEYDQLAAGSLAGHLIECGAQCTGGIFTDWHQVPDWDNMGFPVIECSSDGSFVLTKPPKSGGLVSFGTVAEQLVYEIGDPCRYLLPDVTCDFSHVTITEIPGVEGGAVKVQGAKGLPPSPHYKVCATYLDGFRATAVCPIGGPRAVQKGRRTAESILKRTRRIFKLLGLEDFTAVNVQVLGSEDTYGIHAKERLDDDVREAVIWLAVHHSQKRALEIFSREVAPAGTGMAPGLTGIVGGRPKVSPVLKPFFFLYPKEDVKIDIFINGLHKETLKECSPSMNVEEISPDLMKMENDLKGVVARHPLYYPYIKRSLTAEAVEEYFQHLLHKEKPDINNVTRYELPGIHGLNFVLRNSLGGGGIASLRSDPQGKAFGQMLLDFRVKGVPDLKSLIE
ncbi:uncharacterized protein LOC102362635 isoform X2 [Latimeria chalumnae]|uniref:uncharacterized protein LOC102362635 isoform X2 n=1 Tax=Latimeria chalumnae TaxID=7897 RepID=UPI00313BC533